MRVSDNNSVKTCVNQSEFFEKLGFQDKIFIKETIIFITSKVWLIKKNVKVREKNRAKKFKNESSPEFFSCPFFSEKNFGVTGAKILRILRNTKKSGRLTQVFTLLMSHNNSHASSNFFSHWRCSLYFICLKKNCIFAKDLILKAGFRKKIWLIDTSLHTVVVTLLLSLTRVKIRVLFGG